MKKMSIKLSILLPIISILLVGIVLMVAVVGIQSFQTTNDLTNELVSTTVEQYANEFKALSQEVYGSVAAVAPVVQKIARTTEEPREEIVDVLNGAIAGSDNIICIWTCWEPNALDGKDNEYKNKPNHDSTGRFVPAVSKSQTGSGYQVEPLAGYDSAEDGMYYLGAKNTGNPYVTDPYKYSYGGVEKLIYTISFPLKENGKVVGVVGADIDLQSVMDAMNAGKILKEGYVYTISPGGLIATHPKQEVLLEDFSNNWLGAYKNEIQSILSGGGEFAVKAYSEQIKKDVEFLARGVMIGNTGRYWAVCATVPTNNITASSQALLFIVIGMGVAIMALVGATVLFVVRKGLRGLPVLTSIADAMSVGDIDAANINVDMDSQTKNEVTLLERAFLKMAAGIKQQANILSQIAEGDYSVPEVSIRSEKDVMNQALNLVLDTTNKAMNSIQQASSQVQAGASQISDGAQMLATGSTEQAASIEELSATVTEIKTKAETSASMSEKTKEDFEQINVSVGESMQKMNRKLQVQVEHLGRTVA